MQEPLDGEPRDKPGTPRAGASDISGWIIAGVCLLVIFAAFVYLFGG
jgi:hypothetical protein